MKREENAELGLMKIVITKFDVPQVKEKYMKRQAGLSELNLKKFPNFPNIYIYFMIQIL